MKFLLICSSFWLFFKGKKSLICDGCEEEEFPSSNHSTTFANIDSTTDIAEIESFATETDSEIISGELEVTTFDATFSDYASTDTTTEISSEFTETNSKSELSTLTESETEHSDPVNDFKTTEVFKFAESTDIIETSSDFQRLAVEDPTLSFISDNKANDFNWNFIIILVFISFTIVIITVFIYVKFIRHYQEFTLPHWGTKIKKTNWTI